MRRHLLPVLLLLLAMEPALAQGDYLGRLFLSPSQRANLDRQRQRNPAFDAGLSDTETPLTLNGEVRRSDGRSTRWINGEPRQETLPQIGSLPVGDTLHPGTGERERLLGGRIIVKRGSREP